MLIPRRLDDQSYADIVAEAEARLPWLCPVWTDHNAHDPGITLLELMAWYKELQQYHMDQITPAMRRKLLELAGLRLLQERPAVCTLELPKGAPGRLAGARLMGPHGLPFELLEPVPAERPQLKKICAVRGAERSDITALCAGGTPFKPFAFGGGAPTELLLGLARPPQGELRLWFRVDPPQGPERNRPDSICPPPRTLVWEFVGAGEACPRSDGTWALSWSGAVTLPLPPAWPADEEGLCWLRLRQAAAGCEEEVQLSGIWAGRFCAAQQESRARQYEFTVPAEPKATVRVPSAQAVGAQLALFLRTPKGWEQTASYEAVRGPEGLALTVDAEGAAQDGGANLLLAALDPRHAHELLFDGTGLPGQQVFLDLGGRRALSGRLRLMCQTAEEDGVSRPVPWHLVEDLSVCGPRDRAFTYDPAREVLTFGDGCHGAVPAQGFGSILVSELVLSHCGGGNIPAGAALQFADGSPAFNDDARGGRDEETLAEGRGRLLAQLGRTKKCLSAGDYERCAKETPGLRVAGAKALVGFDPRWGQGRRSAVVTVAVLPAAESKRPVADERFLAAVERQLERCRTICIRTAVVPVRYAPFTLSVQLLAGANARQEEVQMALEALFAPHEEGIGAAARQEDIMAALQKCPGVLQVRRMELRGLDQNSYQTASGDLQVPADAIASLERVEIQLLRP